MALTKRIEVGARTVLANGQIQVRMDTVIEDGGKELSRMYHRHVIAPGDDLSAEDTAVQRVAKAEWTPAVVAAYKAEVAAGATGRA